MVITGPQKQEATFGVRAAGFVTFFFLIGWCWGNRAVLQESCVQSEVTILHLNGSSKALLCIFLWVGTRTLPQGCTTIWLLLLCFCIPSLPWLATVWVYPLELREGQGGWMKPGNYDCDNFLSKWGIGLPQLGEQTRNWKHSWVSSPRSKSCMIKISTPWSAILV